MKKLPLAIAMVSLFTAQTSFAIDSSDQVDTKPTVGQVEIFKQIFDVRVMKESVINIEPPKQEVVEINPDKLEALMTSGENLKIGSMEVQSTAKNCYAKITTMNNFKLQGESKVNKEGGKNTIASYSLSYMTISDSGVAATDTTFASNNDNEKIVSCNTADLKMNVFDHNSNVPADVYNDVITVEVRAES